MRCSYCGRELTGPESRARGFGPKCGASSQTRNSIRIAYETEGSFVAAINRAERLSAVGAISKHVYLHVDQYLLVKTAVGRSVGDEGISDPLLRKLISMFIEIQTAIIKDFLAGKNKGLPL